MVNSIKPSGSNIFQGGGGGGGEGGQLFPGGGSNRLFPIETHITCDFPGGGGSGPPVPPSGSALAESKRWADAYAGLSIRYEHTDKMASVSSITC